jgi:hypothetical protein
MIQTGAGYIYVVLVNTMLKVGCCADFIQRFRQYPKGTIPLQVAFVLKMTSAERALIAACNSNEKLLLVDGREYFRGDDAELLACFHSVAKQFTGSPKQALQLAERRRAAKSDSRAVASTVDNDLETPGVDVQECITASNRLSDKLNSVLAAHGFDPAHVTVRRDSKGHKLDFHVREGGSWKPLKGCRSFPDLERSLKSRAGECG